MHHSIELALQLASWLRAMKSRSIKHSLRFNYTHRRISIDSFIQAFQFYCFAVNWKQTRHLHSHDRRSAKKYFSPHLLETLTLRNLHTTSRWRCKRSWENLSRFGHGNVHTRCGTEFKAFVSKLRHLFVLHSSFRSLSNGQATAANRRWDKCWMLQKMFAKLRLQNALIAVEWKSSFGRK